MFKITYNKTLNFFALIFVISIFLHTNSIYMYVFPISNAFWSIFDCIIALIILFLLIIKNPTFNKRYSILIPYLILIIFSTISNVINDGDELAFFIKYGIFVPSTFLIFQAHNEHLINFATKTFTKLCLFFAVISLFFYIFGQVLEIIPNNASIKTSWTTNEISIDIYYYIHFVPQIGRNSSIFAEAPMYALILSFSILLRYCNKEKIDVQIIILIIAAITTKTLTAYTFIIIFLLLIYIKKCKASKGFKSYFYLLFPILSIIALIILLIYFNNKISGTQGNTSIMMRFDDYLACLKTWYNKPIFGVGYGNELPIIKNMNPLRRHQELVGLANSFGVFLAQGGIIMIIILFIILIYSLYKGNSKKKYISFFFIFFMLVNIFLYTNLFLIFIAFFMSNYNNNNVRFKNDKYNVCSYTQNQY